MDERKIELPLERYVLCVDDDAEFLKSLEIFLPGRVNAGCPEGFWYRFVFIQDPAEALDVLRELVGEGSTVAMLITDQQMPSMKGTELLSEARRIAVRSLRVLLTGHAGIEAAITAINERLLDRYLTKPIEDDHDFTLNVQQLLQRFEMEQLIEVQASALQDLYVFANSINAMDGLDRMVDYVAQFAGSRLASDQICVLAGDGRGHHHGVMIDAAGGPRSLPDSVGLELRAREPAPAADGMECVGEPPSEIRAILNDRGLDIGNTAIYAPLTSGSSLLGFIVAGRRQRRAFTKREQQMLAYIADTASIAILKQLTWFELQTAYRVTRDQGAKLEEANRKLTTLDVMKTEFLRFISHELRTPLSYMSAVGMLEGPIDPENQAEMVSIIRRGYERLERFINKGLDYLDWCGAGRIESTEVLEVRPILRAVVDGLVASAGREVELHVALPESPCPIEMEREQAEEIVRILFDNAVKFSSDKPRIWVTLESSADLVKLEIADRGRGFPPELADDIFRPFMVMDTMHHREGTALNLARASAIVEAHGGRIRAESPGKGKGATFTVELPVAAERPEHERSIEESSARENDAGLRAA